MNTKDLIEKLKEMPEDAMVFLSDNNIEILGIQYELGKVQILMDNTCPNCQELQRELDSSSEYAIEMQEKETDLKDQIKELRKQLEIIRELTN